MGESKKMKIAFWSPFHGQCGTSSNMITVSLLSTMLSEYNTSLFQTSFKYNALETYLLGKSTKVVGEYFQDTGIDALSRGIKSEPLTKENIINCSISLMDEKIHLVPGTSKANREHYETKLLPVLGQIINSLNDNHDLVFIDVNSGLNDEITTRVMNNVDLIVVCLNQNDFVLNEYFANNPFHDKNTFYLIGNYDSHSKYTIGNIRRKYKDIKSDSIGGIPYCTGFRDAMLTTNVFMFFETLMHSTKLDRDYEFLKESKATTIKLLKKINMSRGIRNDKFI